MRRGARIGRRSGRARRSAPSLGGALVALAVVWTLLAAQPLWARRVGDSAAALVAFAGGAAWLVLTRPARRRAHAGWRCFHLLVGAAAGYLSLPAWSLLCGLVLLGLGLPLGAPVPVGSAPPALLPVLLLLGPALEELLYRERLLGALAPGAPLPVVLAALVASSAAFALPHLEPRLVVATFLVGLGLGTAWLATRSLALCVGLHAGLNLAIQVAGVPPTRASLSPAAGAACACALLGLARSSR